MPWGVPLGYKVRSILITTRIFSTHYIHLIDLQSSFILKGTFTRYDCRIKLFVLVDAMLSHSTILDCDSLTNVAFRPEDSNELIH